MVLQMDAGDPAVINYLGRPVGRSDFKNGAAHVATKQRCATLTAKKLKAIQDELRQSKDFAERVALHLGAPP